MFRVRLDGDDVADDVSAVLEVIGAVRDRAEDIERLTRRFLLAFQS